MADPDLEFQGAIVTAFKADAGVTALVGQRVYDSFPPDVIFPYISIGPSDELQIDAECISASTSCFNSMSGRAASRLPAIKRFRTRSGRRFTTTI